MGEEIGVTEDRRVSMGAVASVHVLLRFRSQEN